MTSPFFLRHGDARKLHRRDQWQLTVPNVAYVHGTVTAITAAEKQFKIAMQTGPAITADAVVMCTGFKVPVLKPSVGASEADRVKELAAWREGLKGAKVVVVAGGGPVARLF